jgi:hypothetical protein
MQRQQQQQLLSRLMVKMHTTDGGEARLHVLKGRDRRMKVGRG